MRRSVPDLKFTEGDFFSHPGYGLGTWDWEIGGWRATVGTAIMIDGGISGVFDFKYSLSRET